MLQVPFIRENKDLVIARLAKRNMDATQMINDVISFDEDRRRLQTDLDQTLAESNTLSKEIGNLYKSGEAQKANLLKEKTGQLKEASKELSEALNAKTEALKELLYKIPNVPHDSVPIGNSEADNDTIYQEGDIPKLHEGALPHWELAKKYDIIDFELGNKITGAGFPVYKGKGARLQRALIAYFLDKNVAAGYTEYQLPLMVNEDSAQGTGQLPDKEGQMYHILKDLKLPYRILRLCGGDTSFTAALTYDFEVFSTAQDRWLEISSVSNFETFQANRLKLRFKNSDGKNELAHTLNGSALALPRVLAGIIENYQTEEGILVPEVLQSYTGFKIID